MSDEWKVEDLLKESKAFLEKAKVSLKKGDLANASEELYGSVIRAAQAVVKKITGEEVSDYGRLVSRMNSITEQIEEAEELYKLLERAGGSLHGSCFYRRYCDHIPDRAPEFFKAFELAEKIINTPNYQA